MARAAACGTGRTRPSWTSWLGASCLLTVLGSLPAAAAEADIDTQLALEASRLQDDHCAEVGSRKQADAYLAMSPIVEALVRLSDRITAGGPAYLRYWRAVLGTCVGQTQHTKDDLLRFLHGAESQPELETQVRDARARLRRLGVRIVEPREKRKPRGVPGRGTEPADAGVPSPRASASSTPGCAGSDGGTGTGGRGTALDLRPCADPDRRGSVGDAQEQRVRRALARRRAAGGTLLVAGGASAAAGVIVLGASRPQQEQALASLAQAFSLARSGDRGGAHTAAESYGLAVTRERRLIDAGVALLGTAGIFLGVGFTLALDADLTERRLRRPENAGTP